MLDALRGFSQFAFLPIYAILSLFILNKAIREREPVSLFLCLSQIIMAISLYFSTQQTKWENIWSDYGLIFPILLLHLFHGLYLCKLSRVLRFSVILFFCLVGFFHYLPSFKFDRSGRIIRTKTKHIISNQSIADVFIVPQHPFTDAQGVFYGGKTLGNYVVTIDNPFHNQEFRKLIGLETKVNGINLIFIDGDEVEEEIVTKLNDFFLANFQRKGTAFHKETIYSHPYAKREQVTINSYQFIRK